MRLIDADSIHFCTHNQCMGHGLYEDFTIVSKETIDEIPTVYPDTLPVVQELRKELQNAIAERDAAQVVIGELSGLKGKVQINTVFGLPFAEVQALVEAYKRHEVFAPVLLVRNEEPNGKK